MSILMKQGKYVGYCCCLCYRQDGVESKKKQAECLKKLGEIGLESG